jgi:hypothetical protein
VTGALTRHFTVACDDPTLGTHVERWLRDGLAEPPLPVTVTVRLVDDPWAACDDRPSFKQPGLRFHFGAPDYAVRVVWRDGAGHALLPPGAGAAVTIELLRSAATNPDQWLRPFLLPVLIVLLRRQGWHHIHAATARDRSGRGWLIAGNTHAGKSTTAALLASRGWAVGTDDTAFLDTTSERVAGVAWRSPIALRAGGVAMLEHGAGRSLPFRGKAGFLPEDLGGAWLPRVAIDVVALASLHGAPTRLEPIEPTTAVGDLLSWSLLFLVEPNDAQRHLDLVARLAQQARCFRLLLGSDVIERPEVLEELPT